MAAISFIQKLVGADVGGNIPIPIPKNNTILPLLKLELIIPRRLRHFPTLLNNLNVFIYEFLDDIPPRSSQFHRRIKHTLFIMTLFQIQPNSSRSLNPLHIP